MSFPYHRPTAQTEGRSRLPAPFPGMMPIPGDTFRMGSADFYPEERPVHRVSVDGFWMDVHPVTNAEFHRFVEATDYVTLAERAPNPDAYPGIDPALLVPGSLVFRRPARRVRLRDFRAWWSYVAGACWRQPEGPESSLAGREDHPVVHVAYEDALTYATWAGKSLPSEAEWEFAARGGLDGAIYPWGDDFTPRGQIMANTWHGAFPWRHLAPHGYEGTSPVGAFPANGCGLYDAAGNVWEWTSDLFSGPHRLDAPKCCVPRSPGRSSAPDEPFRGREDLFGSKGKGVPTGGEPNRPVHLEVHRCRQGSARGDRPEQEAAGSVRRFVRDGRLERPITPDRGQFVPHRADCFGPCASK